MWRKTCDVAYQALSQLVQQWEVPQDKAIIQLLTTIHSLYVRSSKHSVPSWSGYGTSWLGAIGRLCAFDSNYTTPLFILKHDTCISSSNHVQTLMFLLMCNCVFLWTNFDKPKTTQWPGKIEYSWVVMDNQYVNVIIASAVGCWSRINAACKTSGRK